ncbi:hypothetical protein BGZ58_003620 [Dissophora ornata]|nr:hypothetical protein BGZ58_003620 [Dissophora ornata]
MSGLARNSKTVPTFLQPNTVLSSRAAIFEDDFKEKTKEKAPSNKQRSLSRRNQYQDGDQDDASDNDDDDEMSKSILERLYGQLQGAIEIQDTDMTTPFERNTSTNADQSEAKENDSMHGEQGGEEDQMESMEFRLFASQDTPTAIILNKKEPEIVHVHRERPELDESPGSERMQQIEEASIDAATILEQAKIPWARTFFAHKVIHIPIKQSPRSTKVKKSKRKREWEKKLKAGLIDQAKISSTARKVKVSESWGQPVLVRKGLDRNTIDAGTATSSEPKKREAGDYASRGGGRGGRGGGGRGGRGVRGGRGGSVRGGGRGGGSVSIHREPYHERAKEEGKESAKRKHENGNKDAPKSKSDAITASPNTGTSLISQVSASASTVSSPAVLKKKSVVPKAALPVKKPKSTKPMSKLDNIMAILTGK